MKPVKLTAMQYVILDKAIVNAVASGPVRAGQIERNHGVVRALATLPPGKSDMRYIDGALQRLRKAGAIRLVRDGWVAA